MGANLESASFLGRVNLARANLERANLEGTCLIGANLEGASLMGANLTCTDLSGAKLEKVNLLGVKKLANSNGVGPSLVDVQWGDTNLTVVDWSQIKFLEDEWQARQKNDMVSKRIKGRDFRNIRKQ